MFSATRGFRAGSHRSGWIERELATATNRTPDVIRAATLALAETWHHDGKTYGYRKTGVVLGELRPEGTEQVALFDGDGLAATVEPEWTEAQARLMAAVDGLNGRFGKRAVTFGTMGTPSVLRKTRDGSGGAPRWEMCRLHMSPRYTTRLGEVARVRV